MPQLPSCSQKSLYSLYDQIQANKINQGSQESLLPDLLKNKGEALGFEAGPVNSQLELSL